MNSVLLVLLQQKIWEKSQTSEGGGTHLRISVWHLLMNLKNNYLLKNLLKWANKKCKNFNIYNVVFFEKIKKNTRRYHYFTPVHQKSWCYDLQFLKYRVWRTEIGNYGSFFALLTPSLKTQTIRILKKWKTLLEISSFYKCVPKTMITQNTVSEIQLRHIFCHFGPFLPFYPTYNLENQNLKKLKKASGDVIILHLCPKDHDHMMYASWDMERNRYTFLSIWTRRYYPFTHVYHKWALWPF